MDYFSGSRVFRMAFVLALTGFLVVIACRAPQPVPEQRAGYNAAGYQGQVSSKTRKDLQEHYPKEFWKMGSRLPSDKEKVRIGVRQFDGSAQIEDLRRMVTDIFYNELTRSGYFDVFEREQMGKVVSEFELNQTGLADPATTKNAGRLTGIEVLVTGSVYQSQQQSRVDVRVLDLETGKVVISEKIDAAIDSASVTSLARTLVNTMVGHWYGQSVQSR